MGCQASKIRADAPLEVMADNHSAPTEAVVSEAVTAPVEEASVAVVPAEASSFEAAAAAPADVVADQPIVVPTASEAAETPMTIGESEAVDVSTGDRIATAVPATEGIIVDVPATETATTTPIDIVIDDDHNNVVPAEIINADAAPADEIVADVPETVMTSTDAVAVEAPVEVMAERPATTANVRRVAFDKETLRRTAPKTTVVATTVSNNKLTKKQQQMVQNGHKSSGRRGPVGSKHSRCKAQMQTDVYFEMANAFERLLTNVNTIDAHLDSR